MNATPTHPDHGDVPARPPASTGPSEPGPAPLLNIANILTIVRLVLVPVFVQLMLGQGGDVRLMATAVFIGAALTDRLDGQLARSRGLVTSFGKIADPIADKALTLSAFVLLVVFAVSLWHTIREQQAPRWLLTLALFALPLPWLAAELGWFVAEFGRQPWIIEGVLPTFLATSELGVTDLLITIALFTLVYGALAVVEVRLMLAAIRKGPEIGKTFTPRFEPTSPRPGQFQPAE